MRKNLVARWGAPLGLAMLFVGGVGCSDSPGDAQSGCETDTDCKGDRVCSRGQCVDPSSSGGTGAGGTGVGGSGGAGAASGGSAGTGGGVACLPEGSPCAMNDDCCGVSNSPPVMCVDFGEGRVECAQTCEVAASSCTNCCYPFPGQDELGLCATASVCAAFQQCLEGVVNICSCGAIAGEPCSDIENLYDCCARTPSGCDSAAFFHCAGGFPQPTTLSQCTTLRTSCE